MQARLDALLGAIACHSVVRAGDRLSPGEAETLLRSLDGVDLSLPAPHGRAVLLRLPLTEDRSPLRPLSCEEGFRAVSRTRCALQDLVRRLRVSRHGKTSVGLIPGRNRTLNARRDPARRECAGVPGRGGRRAAPAAGDARPRGHTACAALARARRCSARWSLPGRRGQDAAPRVGAGSAR